MRRDGLLGLLYEVFVLRNEPAQTLTYYEYRQLIILHDGPGRLVSFRFRALTPPAICILTVAPDWLPASGFLVALPVQRGKTEISRRLRTLFLTPGQWQCLGFSNSLPLIQLQIPSRSQPRFCRSLFVPVAGRCLCLDRPIRSICIPSKSPASQAFGTIRSRDQTS